MDSHEDEYTYREITTSLVNQMHALHGAGWTADQIARQLRVSEYVVNTALNARAVIVRPWTERDKRRLARLYRCGTTRAAMAKSLGRTQDAIGRMIQKLQARGEITPHDTHQRGGRCGPV